MKQPDSTDMEVVPLVLKSTKLASVCYDIRGPVMARAKHMEEDGHRIIKLNIGNLASFGFEAPEEIQQDVIHNLPNSSGYSDSKGLFAARKAIMHYAQQKNIEKLLCTGVQSAQAAIHFEATVHFDDIDALTKAVLAELPQVASVLVKGSRFMKMERVVQAIEARADQTGGAAC